MASKSSFNIIFNVILAVIFVIQQSLQSMYNPTGGNQRLMNYRRLHNYRNDVQKLLVENLSTNNEIMNKCNATIITLKRLLMPNECTTTGTNGQNNNQTIRIYLNDQNSETKSITRNIYVILKLQKSNTSLIEMNETLPIINYNSNYNRQEHFIETTADNNRPINAESINYDHLTNHDLDGRQFLPPMIAPPPFPILPPLPIIQPIGVAYEFEFYEYQWCRPMGIEIGVCELCVWMPTVCPVVF